MEPNVDKALQQFLNEFGVEETCDALARFFRADREAFLLSAERQANGAGLTDMDRLVAKCIEGAEEHAKEAGMQWYISTK